MYQSSQYRIEEMHPTHPVRCIPRFSTSLKAVLELYLQLWDWESEYNLFPTSSNSQMTVHALETAVRHFNIGRGVNV